MDEGTLSRAMDDFAARRADILLCTAIIEAGLDLPVFPIEVRDGWIYVKV